MKRPIKFLNFSFFILLIVTLFIACDKDFANIDSDVLGDENANFNPKDTILPVAAYSKKLEGLQIDNLASNLLGFFYDPSFGNTTASIITQLVPSSFSPSFGENPVIDSIVINIPYYSSVIGSDENGNSLYKLDSVFGNRNAEIKLSIYQNNYFLRDFDPSGGAASTQNYYSNAISGLNSALTKTTTINFDNHMGELILSDTILPSSAATVLVQRTETDTTATFSAPSYRAILKSDDAKNYWKNIIIDKEGDAVLSNQSNFKNYFRGLYLKAEAIENDGQMALLNLTNVNSNVTIYYSYGEADSRLQSTYTLNFSGNTLNTFINDFTNPLQNGNPTEGDANLYLKGQEGSMAVVDLFPNNSLDDFKNKFTDGEVPIKLINEAYLEVYEDMSKAINGDYGSEYHKYDRIYAYDIENNIPLIDYDFDQSTNTQSPFSSKFISLSLRDTISGKYKIRLTEHLKNILLRDSTNTKIGLVLSNNVNYTSNSEILNPDDEVTGIPSAAIISPRGTVLHGSHESVNVTKRLKFKVFYTEPK
ncbi:DUF4270 domain-containing protein [Flavisericum labens]|uniref:DUF4270 domain-containing protein n=1 Tax=Flavisericum labens TaxID=3377112 RepID=UPI00387B4753